MTQLRDGGLRACKSCFHWTKGSTHDCECINPVTFTSQSASKAAVAIVAALKHESGRIRQLPVGEQEEVLRSMAPVFAAVFPGLDVKDIETYQRSRK